MAYLKPKSELDSKPPEKPPPEPDFLSRLLIPLPAWQQDPNRRSVFRKAAVFWLLTALGIALYLWLAFDQATIDKNPFTIAAGTLLILAAGSAANALLQIQLERSRRSRK